MAIDRPAQQNEIKLLISKGLEQGYLTYAEVNDHLPDDIVDPEQIEDIIGMINGMGIDVPEVAPDAETLLLSDATPTRSEDDTVAAVAAARHRGVVGSLVSTDDPGIRVRHQVGGRSDHRAPDSRDVGARRERGVGVSQHSLSSGRLAQPMHQVVQA